MGFTRPSNSGPLGVKYKNALMGQSFAAGAVVPIAFTTIATDGNNAVFSAIPQTFQDLMFVINGRVMSTSANDCVLQIGQDGGSKYSVTALIGNGSAASSTRATSASFMGTSYLPNANAASGIRGSVVWHILNYANTSTFKTVLSRGAADTNGSGFAVAAVSLWRSTAGVSYVEIFGNSGLSAGTTVALYGIRAGNS